MSIFREIGQQLEKFDIPGAREFMIFQGFI